MEKSEIATTNAGNVPAIQENDAEKRVTQQKRIEENREKNLKLLNQLTEDLQKVVADLATGKLIVPRLTPAGIVVRGEPTLKDRLDLIAYAKGIQELTYRALGDTESVSQMKAERGLAGQTVGNVTIILPPVVSKPRGTREIEIDAVDIE